MDSLNLLKIAQMSRYLKFVTIVFLAEWFGSEIIVCY